MRGVLASLIAAGLGLGGNALAQGVYVDAGLGATYILGGTAFFGQGSSVMTIAAAGNTFLAYEINPSSALQVHLGLAGRLNVGVEPNLVASTISVYPAVRFEFERFYLTAGVSPGLVWKRVSGGAGITDYSIVRDALGGYADVGLLWRPVSYWHMALAISGESYLRGAGVLSPMPIFGAFIEMRFYIYQAKGGGSGGGAVNRKFDGWRYPFGVNKK